MSIDAKLSWESPESNSKTTIVGSFEEDEWDTLHAFMTCAESLWKIELLQSDASCNLNIQYNEVTGLSTKTELPPEEQILVLLHRLRPFILQNEKTNFYKTVNLLARRYDDSHVRKFLKDLKGTYSGTRMQDLIRITSNNVLINCDKTLMNWLNAHEYHRDATLQKDLADLHKVMPLESTRAIFISMLFDKVKCIEVLWNIIQVICDKRREFSCKIS